MQTEHFDVIVVGAGLSGVSAAWHLQTLCPDRSFVILEGRETMGGTWDLFRYPGIRSDSDMFTLGYHFRPWRDAKAIADGPAIRTYIWDTAEEFDIVRKIRFSYRVTRAEWSSASSRWTIDVVIGADHVPMQFTCNFLYSCTGYYDYEGGYTPTWPGMGSYKGVVVHPQHWPESLDYSGKRVVVIGSGATAVTLVPALAEQAAHVTMLQRSPTYVITRPSRDAIANLMRKVLPERTAYAAARWKNVMLSIASFKLARSRPAFMKKLITRGVQKSLGPEFDVATHFSPTYNPWDQRLCLVPDGDLFTSINKGKASMVTDEIESFTDSGIRLRSGRSLDADIVVTATGLVMKLLGGMSLVIDGDAVHLRDTLAYKGMMYSDVPNLASAFGYTNASWTLKCDLTAQYVCRLLNHMHAHGFTQCTPRLENRDMDTEPVVDFSSGYVQRALPNLPRQGKQPPWRVHQNYLMDRRALRGESVEDGTMEFTVGQTASQPAMR